MSAYLYFHVDRRLEGKVLRESIAKRRGLMRRSSGDEHMDAGAIQIGNEYQTPICIRLGNLAESRASRIDYNVGIEGLAT